MLKLKTYIIIILCLFSTIAFSQKKRVEKGIASYYHNNLKGNRTANGERYSPTEMTAAHLTLPFDSQVRVVNLKNNKSVIVRINDRGPFVERRIIDLSRAAADSLDFIENGLAHVEIDVLCFGKPNGNNQQQLLANRNKSIKLNSPIIKIEKDSAHNLWVFNQPKTSCFVNEKNELKKESISNKNFTDSINVLWAFNQPKTIPVINEIKPLKTEAINKSIIIDSINTLWVFNQPLNSKSSKIELPNNNISTNKRTPNNMENALWVFNLPKTKTVKEEIKPISPIDSNNLSLAFATIFKNKAVKNKLSSPSPTLTIQKDTAQISISGLVYGVQIGSFKLRSNMLKLSEKLKKNYIDKINVQEVNKDSVHFYRLLLGECVNKTDAEKLKERIKNEYPQSFIISFNIK
ncbi:MAG: septal ring lytic transglycosylase RlpA family protein [Bacteroidota bacterium]